MWVINKFRRNSNFNRKFHQKRATKTLEVKTLTVSSSQSCWSFWLWACWALVSAKQRSPPSAFLTSTTTWSRSSRLCTWRSQSASESSGRLSVTTWAPSAFASTLTCPWVLITPTPTSSAHGGWVSGWEFRTRIKKPYFKNATVWITRSEKQKGWWNPKNPCRIMIATPDRTARRNLLFPSDISRFSGFFFVIKERSSIELSNHNKRSDAFVHRDTFFYILFEFETSAAILCNYSTFYTWNSCRNLISNILLHFVSCREIFFNIFTV